MNKVILVRNVLFIALLFSSVEVEAKRINLPKNIIDGRNVLTQSMFHKVADEYVVRYNYDLKGDTITLPVGAKLVFKGSGCLNHGTLIGHNSSIKANKKSVIFSDISVKGCWRVGEIYSKWFDFGSGAEVNTRNFQNMCSLSGDEYSGVIHILEGDYMVKFDNTNSSCLKPNCNTSIILDGNILLQPNKLDRYSIIDISNKHSISISGKGSIIGDVKNHLGEKGEWGMGVKITSSKDISIQDITIKDCWGDCIYIGQSKISKDDYSEGVRIEQVTCDGGRRQGLSLIAGKNIIIKNCSFKNTGKIKYTSPGRGIDIEPNDKDNTIVQDILIEDCVFSGNYNNNDFLTYNLNPEASIMVIRCNMEGRVSLYQNSYNVVIDSCEIHSLDYVDSVISNNIVRNTVFKSMKPNTSAPQKVRFENCDYPDDRASVFGGNRKLPLALLAGGFLLSIACSTYKHRGK